MYERGIKAESLAARGGISEPVRLYHPFGDYIRTSSILPFLGDKRTSSDVNEIRKMPLRAILRIGRGLCP